VFNDFVTMGICSFHRQNIETKLKVPNPENEKLYLDTIKGYSKDELNEFAKLLGLVQLQVSENPYSDILGEFYTEWITHGENGQYFTPEPVSDLMSELQSKEPIEHQRVLDPACGASIMLLRFANKHPNNYFFGVDNNLTCAKISTLNFFLNGLRGEVACMNSLSMEW
jgi:type I restriction-modification system DNA methylase subunit